MWEQQLLKVKNCEKLLIIKEMYIGIKEFQNQNVFSHCLILIMLYDSSYILLTFERNVLISNSWIIFYPITDLYDNKYIPLLLVILSWDPRDWTILK